MDRRANAKPTRNDYLGDRPWKGPIVERKLDPAVVQRELHDTPYIIATRDIQPRENTLIDIFDCIKSPHKRRVMVDTERKIYVSYQDTPAGERDAENLALYPGDSMDYRGKYLGFSFEYRRTVRKS